MPQVDGWFFESTPFDDGVSLGFRVDEVLLETQTDFQNLKILRNSRFGRILVLDNVIQVTESDEFSYHEMFVHVPMNSHPDPKRVCVVGAGDGGILRELIKYDSIERIDQCEIDGGVIEASKDHLPFTASGYEDPRVNVYVEDGAKFIEEHKGEYDLILVDSSDPIGPAEVLFRRAFFEGMKAGLRENGVAITQCETIFYFLPLIKQVIESVRDLYPRIQYMNTLVPTYPSGMIGQLVCSLGPDLSKPVRRLPEEIQSALKYYSPEVHEAAFKLPAFAARELPLD
jgi:spermidine synthase